MADPAFPDLELVAGCPQRHRWEEEAGPSAGGIHQVHQLPHGPPGGEGDGWEQGGGGSKVSADSVGWTEADGIKFQLFWKRRRQHGNPLSPPP